MEFFGTDPFDISIQSAAFHIQALRAFVHRQGHFFIGQIADQVNKGSGRNCNSAFFFDLSPPDPGADPPNSRFVAERRKRRYQS